jgi:hypothetical protein
LLPCDKAGVGEDLHMVGDGGLGDARVTEVTGMDSAGGFYRHYTFVRAE